ncbi:hypothetical protein ACWGI8_03190 [Streptomyces sp. NPDC054841]
MPASTLRRAASGGEVPRLPVVRAAIIACGGPVDDAVALWKQARYHQRLRDTPRDPVPPPELVWSRAEMKAALVELYERDGAPALEKLESRAGSNGELPHSTAARIVKGLKLPGTRAQFEAYLTAVEVEDPAERRLWVFRAPGRPTTSSPRSDCRTS